MRRFLVWLVVAGVALGDAMARAAAPPTVLVLGDSLSAAHDIAADRGWVRLLDARLANMMPGSRVINASISGETTLSGRHRLPVLLRRYHPTVVILELGANDGLRGLPLADLRANLAAMIDAAGDAGAKVLLLGIELPVNYGPRYRDGLRRVYGELAREKGVALVPFLLEGVALDATRMQADGMHPNARGEPAVLDNVWPALLPLLGPVGAGKAEALKKS